MDHYAINDTATLRQIIALHGTDVLFRGQVRQYGTDLSPVMNTSFERSGCVPSLTYLWSHYAKLILSALLQIEQKNIIVDFMQAVLQHYGWRSFYLDASANAGVSSWFSAHTFKANRGFDLCEDCFEDPAFLMKLRASYDYEQGGGYLYILSKEALLAQKFKLFDLSSINMPEHRPRFYAQQAWLIGPLHGNLPIDCIKAVVKAPRSVLRQFAEEEGFHSTNDLFPDSNADPVLRLLLQLPWIEIQSQETNLDIPFFQHPIEIPEYQDSFTKRNPPNVAFYRGSSAADAFQTDNIKFYDAPDDIITGSADLSPKAFPNIMALLDGVHEHTIFEINNLIRQPFQRPTEYQKGIAITKVSDNLFCVADFAVEHPGLKLSGGGINAGWHYAVSKNGHWERSKNSNDCPCENTSLHEQHISALTNIESHLENEDCEVRPHENSSFK